MPKNRDSPDVVTSLQLKIEVLHVSDFNPVKCT